MTSRKVALTAAFLALAAGGTAACDNPGDDELAGSTYEWESDDHDTGSGSGSGSYGSDLSEAEETSEAEEEEAEDTEAATDEVFYCADEEGEILEEDYCADADETSSYFLWYSPGYARGLAPGTFLDGGDYISAGDREARRAFKLPATGKVANGTIKTGVVGRSSGGSGIGSGTSGG
jgi:hypothetical protein